MRGEGRAGGKGEEKESDHSKGTLVDLDTEGSRSVMVVLVRGLVGGGVARRRGSIRRRGTP